MGSGDFNDEFNNSVFENFLQMEYQKTSITHMSGIEYTVLCWCFEKVTHSPQPKCSYKNSVTNELVWKCKTFFVHKFEPDSLRFWFVTMSIQLFSLGGYLTLQ